MKYLPVLRASCAAILPSLLALGAMPFVHDRGAVAQAASTPTHTWGFVTAKVDSRFSYYVYTGYGYDAVFVVGALVENPRSGYSEQIVGLGARLPVFQDVSQSVAVTFCNASDSRYVQVYYLPSRRFGRVSASAGFETYLPLEPGGVRQFAIGSLPITARVHGPLAAGIVYEMSAAEHVATSHGAGIAIRLDVPHAELGLDALRGVAHRQDHARISFRAFY